MLKFDVNIIDKIRNKEDYIQYTNRRCLKFKDLFELIWKLYPDYEGENMTLLFVFGGSKKLIREFNLYIRNGDIIEIILSSSSYFLCDIQGFQIEQNDKISNLYVKYHILAIPYEVFIVKIEYDQLYLVDVLDSGKQRYNECINRLISRYNY